MRESNPREKAEGLGIQDQKERAAGEHGIYRWSQERDGREKSVASEAEKMTSLLSELSAIPDWLPSWEKKKKALDRVRKVRFLSSSDPHWAMWSWSRNSTFPSLDFFICAMGTINFPGPSQRLPRTQRDNGYHRVPQTTKNIQRWVMLTAILTDDGLSLFPEKLEACSDNRPALPLPHPDRTSNRNKICKRAGTKVVFWAVSRFLVLN